MTTAIGMWTMRAARGTSGGARLRCPAETGGLGNGRSRWPVLSADGRVRLPHGYAPLCGLLFRRCWCPRLARSFDDQHSLHVVLPVARERAEEGVAAGLEGHESGAGLPWVDLPGS